MAFPVDSRYFDQFPLVYNNIDWNDDLADNFPTQVKLHDMVYAKYGEKIWTSPIYVHWDLVAGITIYEMHFKDAFVWCAWLIC